MKRYDKKIVVSSLMVLMSIMLISAGHTQSIVPNTFSSGDVISASEMNENFGALETAIESGSSSSNGITGISRTIVTASSAYSTTYAPYGSDVKTATCGSGTTLVGGSCSCYHISQNLATTNWGAVTQCIMIGNSVIGGCWDYDPYSYKYGPPITVYAVCLSTTTSVSGLSSADEPDTESELPPEVLEKIQQIQQELKLRNDLMLEKAKENKQ